MLPDPYRAPLRLGQASVGVSVALDVRRELGLPPSAVGGRPRAVNRARRPRAPVNEDGRRLSTTDESVLAWRRRFEAKGAGEVGRVAPKWVRRALAAVGHYRPDRPARLQREAARRVNTLSPKAPSMLHGHRHPRTRLQSPSPLRRRPEVVRAASGAQPSGPSTTGFGAEADDHEKQATFPRPARGTNCSPSTARPRRTRCSSSRPRRASSLGRTHRRRCTIS